MTLQSNRDASTPDVPWKNPSARPWQTGGGLFFPVGHKWPPVSVVERRYACWAP